ncbi:MAG: 30S ribosomal protein S15 [Candidatus Micrarchaeia archaeon]|jgi:small subunit ribosomal protein S15
MAKLHTKGKGKSKSRKPDVEIGKMPEDLKLSKEEIEKIVENLAKQHTHQAMIGQILREKYGVKYFKQVFGKRLGEVLEEKGLLPQLPQDLLDLMKKAVNIRAHLEKNHKDVHNKVRLARVESKIWRLTKYYKKEGILPSNWKYDPNTAALLIKGE